MKFIRTLLIGLVRLFFLVYFYIFGKPKLNKIIDQTIKLYSGGGFVELFAMIRSWDSPFEKINKVTPSNGLIVDLGCGDGILTNYLAIAKTKRRLQGIELNTKRIKEADKGLKNTKFTKGNILTEKIPMADAVILAHVLHHLPSFDSQIKLLKNIRKSLNNGGKLVIVEIDKAPFVKFVFTWLTDVITVPILFDGKLFDTQIHYRPVDKWRNLLESLNFKVKTIEAHTGTPFSSVILVCE